MKEHIDYFLNAASVAIVYKIYKREQKKEEFLRQTPTTFEERRVTVRIRVADV